MWDNIGQVKSNNYSVLFLPDFYRYFGAPLKMREHMYVHICMYICICIYVYICMYVPIRSDAPIRSDPIPMTRSEVTKLQSRTIVRDSTYQQVRGQKKGKLESSPFPPNNFSYVSSSSTQPLFSGLFG